MIPRQKRLNIPIINPRYLKTWCLTCGKSIIIDLTCEQAYCDMCSLERIKEIERKFLVVSKEKSISSKEVRTP